MTQKASQQLTKTKHYCYHYIDKSISARVFCWKTRNMMAFCRTLTALSCSAAWGHKQSQRAALWNNNSDLIFVVGVLLHLYSLMQNSVCTTRLKCQSEVPLNWQLWAKADSLHSVWIPPTSSPFIHKALSKKAKCDQYSGRRVLYLPRLQSLNCDG